MRGGAVMAKKIELRLARKGKQTKKLKNSRGNKSINSVLVSYVKFYDLNAKSQTNILNCRDQGFSFLLFFTVDCLMPRTPNFFYHLSLLFWKLSTIEFAKYSCLWKFILKQKPLVSKLIESLSIWVVRRNYLYSKFLIFAHSHKKSCNFSSNENNFLMWNHTRHFFYMENGWVFHHTRKIV